MGDNLETILAGDIGPPNDCGGMPDKSVWLEYWELPRAWATLEIAFTGKPPRTGKACAEPRNYIKVGSTKSFIGWHEVSSSEQMALGLNSSSLGDTTWHMPYYNPLSR